MEPETSNNIDLGVIFTSLYQFITRLQKLNYSEQSIKTYQGALKKLAAAYPDTFPEQRELTIWFFDTFGNMAPSSVRMKSSAIKTFIKYLQEVGKLDESYTWNPKTPIVKNQTTIHMQHNDMVIALESIRDIRDKALMTLLYSTGIRVSECTNLDIENINFCDGRLKFFGKGGKDRNPAFDEDTGNLLQKYLNGRTNGPVFLSKRGNRMTPRAVQMLVKRYFPAGITPHKIRHSCLTVMAEQGASEHYLMAQSGHSTTAALGRYIHQSETTAKNGHIKYHPLNKKINPE